MKIYGLAQNRKSELSLLTETIIIAEPEALRDLAAFLYRCAEGIEDNQSNWEHEQFESNETVAPHIMVFNPDAVDESRDEFS